MVLGIDHGDVAVRERHIEQPEEPGVLPECESRSAETVLAIRFHFSGELSYQKRAISVWSAVRALGVVTSSPPRDFTSLKSAVYFFLSTA